MPITPYELQIWSDIRDLLTQLVEKQNMIIEFYSGLEEEGKGRNKLQMPEGMETELSNKDVS